jgi:hypothetical protein
MLSTNIAQQIRHKYKSNNNHYKKIHQILCYNQDIYVEKDPFVVEEKKNIFVNITKKKKSKKVEKIEH